MPVLLKPAGRNEGGVAATPGLGKVFRFRGKLVHFPPKNAGEVPIIRFFRGESVPKKQENGSLFL